MNRIVCTFVIALLIGSGMVSAQSRGKTREHAGDHVSGSIHVVFGRGEVELLRSHYAPRYRNLPPGLQKKLARTGTLPPGWQKKLEPFPQSLDRRLTALPAGYVRGVFDGHAVIVRNGVLVDVSVLF